MTICIASQANPAYRKIVVDQAQNCQIDWSDWSDSARAWGFWICRRSGIVIIFWSWSYLWPTTLTGDSILNTTIQLPVRLQQLQLSFNLQNKLSSCLIRQLYDPYVVRATVLRLRFVLRAFFGPPVRTTPEIDPYVPQDSFKRTVLRYVGNAVWVGHKPNFPANT